MLFTNEQYNNSVQKCLLARKVMRVGTAADESKIHAILHSAGMKLSKKTKLFYTRMPDLNKSYQEAFEKTLLFVNGEDISILSALSEYQFFSKGQRVNSYYASDLRILPKTRRRDREDFDDLYRDLIQGLPEDENCTTVILEENKDAIKKFRNEKSAISYNLMFKYVTRTIVILPTIFFARFQRTKNIKILPVDDLGEHEIKYFIEENLRKMSFSHDTLGLAQKRKNQKNFKILRDGRIHGFFSIYRPEGKSILIESKSLWINFLLKVVNIFTRTDSINKVSWKFMTGLILSDDLKEEKSILSSIISYLKSKAEVKSGELLLIVHPMSSRPCFKFNQSSAHMSLCPQIIKNALFFRVETTPQDRSMEGDINLDPTLL